MRFFSLIFMSLSLAVASQIPTLDFELIKKETHKGPTLLLIGGIQGDEPGGFNTTSIFLRHYKISNGNVWVVPVLNKHSMLLNHRGVYDDMNRKFAALSPNDPEYPLVQRIKSLITDPKVDALLHLHDGSGFYRPTYVSANMNPNRWGACNIIDQENLPDSKFPNLGEIATNTIGYINARLIKPEHQYFKKNTQTSKGDVEMEKALTFFAIRNNKSAFANEASKDLSLEERVYYHLLALEGLMVQLGIEFERDFTLTPKKLYYLINDTSMTATLERSITLPLYGLREELSYFPLPKKDAFLMRVDSASHIVGLYPREDKIALKYGNKLMTKLKPQYFDFDYSIKQVRLKIDGKEQEVPMGSIINVKKSFEILSSSDYRVNVIGFVAYKNTPRNKQNTPATQGALLASDAKLDSTPALNATTQSTSTESATTPIATQGVTSAKSTTPPAKSAKLTDESDYTITLKDCQERFSIDKKGKIYRAEFYKGEQFAGMVLFRFR